MKMYTTLLGSLFAIISVAYTHPIPNKEQSRDSVTNIETHIALQKMMEKNILSQVDDRVADTEDFGAENLARENDMIQQTAALSQFDDQNADTDKSADESNMFQKPEEDDQPETASNWDFNPENLAEKDSMFQEPALSQVGDQAKIAHFKLKNLADESNVFQQPAALSQVDGQTDIKSDKDFQAEDESNMFQQPVPIQVDDRKLDIESDQEFSPQTLADEGNTFQQFATFQVTDTDCNQNFKRETHADESNVFQEPSLSQMDDQQRDMVTDNSNDLTYLFIIMINCHPTSIEPV